MKIYLRRLRLLEYLIHLGFVYMLSKTAYDLV